MGAFVDMTGWIMNEHGVPNSLLTVIKRAEDYISPCGTHYIQWLCECKCGSQKYVVVRGSRLRDGSVTSCGCVQRNISKTICKTNFKKYNEYDLSGEYGVGWTTNTHREFLFELNRFDEIKDYCWSEQVCQGTHKLRAYDAKTKKHIYMHQLLGYSRYDHIDRNELNNLESNLRPCTKQENSFNQSIGTSNTSGIIGVYFDNSRCKWVAQLMKNGVHKLAKRFDNKNDAIVARLSAEKEHFGEFAPQRHLFEEYGIT